MPTGIFAININRFMDESNQPFYFRPTSDTIRNKNQFKLKIFISWFFTSNKEVHVI